MHDDDDPLRDDRGRRGPRSHGPGRRSRPSGFERLFEGRGGASRSNLFDRIVRDVTAWFDDEEEPAGTRREGGARRDRDAARPHGYPERFEDLGPGAFSPDESGHAHRVGDAADDYADEDAVSGSLRGRGPRNYRRSDERIAELVNDALHDDDTLDASDVEVSVQAGDVTLAGAVPTRRQKHRAENLATRVAGVHDVDNRLRVRRAAEDGPSATAAGGTPGEARRDADDYGHP